MPSKMNPFIYSIILLIAAVLLIWNYIAGMRKTEKNLKHTTQEKPATFKTTPAPSSNDQTTQPTK